MQNLKTDNNEQRSYDKLVNLVDYKKGKKPSSLVPNPQNGYVPYIDIEAFEKGLINRYTNDKSAPFSDKDKDILVVWDGARAGLVGKASGVVGSTLMRLTPKDINRDYLLFFLVSKYREISTNHRGTGIPHVNPDIFWGFEVPVPSPDEQNTIAKKLSYLIPLIEQNKLKIAKAKKLVAKFRQAILFATFKGKLTEDWRLANAEIEPASELLGQIKEFKLKQVTNLKQKERITRVYSSFEKNEHFDLPSSWVFCSIDHIGEVTNGSTPSRKNPLYWKGNIPWVSSGEVNNNFINVTREQITRAGFENSSVKILPIGTVLIAMIGEGKTRGRSAILNIEATTNQNVAGIKIEHGYVLPKYLWFWLQCQYENTRSYGGGSNQQALNCQRVRELPFVLPPFKEQEEIVNRISKYFDIANQVEKQIEKAETRIVKLSQAILAKTFNQE